MALIQTVTCTCDVCGDHCERQVQLETHVSYRTLPELANAPTSHGPILASHRKDVCSPACLRRALIAYTNELAKLKKWPQ